MRVSQRPSCAAVEPSLGSNPWRYCIASRKPTSSCAATAARVGTSIAQVAHDPNVLFDTNGSTNTAIVYASRGQGQIFMPATGNSVYFGHVNNGATDHTTTAALPHHDESSSLSNQQDILGQCYSSATVSAMARLLGHHNTDLLMAAGQASVMMLPKPHLLEVLKAGSGTPLDEASAALALLCEAGQYGAVVQYGTPLLKAASAAVPFSPLGVGKQPVPHLEHLAGDLALSIALAHISLAAGDGASSVAAADAAAGAQAGVVMPSGMSGGAGGSHSGLEEVYGHLEAALQVLERHSVAAPLQHEVAYCLQGVAVAYAEEVLRSTPPVAPVTPASASSPSGQPAGTQHVSGGGTTGGSSSASAASRRTKAISMLRGALWRNNHSHSQQPSGAAATHPLDAAAAGNGGGGGGCWPPDLTPDERMELMAPLRGLLAASEHIALYGPAASGQKAHAAVQLSDQELYDLAIAHLAQGVSTGWPQHVLQALSCFERVSQQQQQHGGAAACAVSASAGAAAAVDVSFERSVCEALLGRRGTAAGPAVAVAAGSTAAASGAAAPSPFGEEWDDGDESALLRRLEAQLSLTAVSLQPQHSAANGVVSFSVDERHSGTGDDEDEADARQHQPAAASLPAGEGSAAGSGAQPQHAAATSAASKAGDKAAGAAASKGSRARSDRDDVSRRYGWAESWLELSVMPCFPETAGAGAQAVSLARWFADPRVILFNQLLAVRSGEAQVTAALGSAVAHVSDASRQRLWQLWQAAAHAVSSARGQPSPQQSPAATASTAPVPAQAATVVVPEVVSAGGSGSNGGGGAAAPLASGLLAQSRAALQDVGPRAAAAASAVAAAAAAVGSAAASSPRAVAAAASWMVPFGLPRWGAVAGQGPAPGRLATAVAATATKALPRKAAAGDAASATSWDGATGEEVGSEAAQRRPAPTPTPGSPRVPSTNNVVPFPPATGSAGGSSAVSPPPPAAAAAAAPPVAGGLVDVALTAPPAGGGTAAVPAAATGPSLETDAGGVGALWAPDAEGHLRPRMVARVVQRAAAAAASIKERVAALPVSPREWSNTDPAADEAQSREAVRRVAAVAAQAVCLGALAAYVGHRILASGALQAAGGAAGGGAAAAPAVDASTAQVAAAAQAVSRWLSGAAAAAAPGAMGQWPLRGEELAPAAAAGSATATSVKSLGRLAEQYGKDIQLNEASAVALLRGWAAARAAASGLADPRDRTELLSGLLGGKALKRARAEADRNARLGRRVDVQRLEVAVEQLRRLAVEDPAAGAVEVAVTAVVMTAGTEANRAAPLPAAFCSRERLTVVFRREAEAGGGLWRLVDVRDAPPALY